MKFRILTLALGVGLIPAVLVAAYSAGAVSSAKPAGTICASSKGALRYVASGPCSRGETAIQIGTPGPIGPRGPQGPAGLVGPQGATVKAWVSSYDSSAPIQSLSFYRGTCTGVGWTATPLESWTNNRACVKDFRAGDSPTIYKVTGGSFSMGSASGSCNASYYPSGALTRTFSTDALEGTDLVPSYDQDFCLMIAYAYNGSGTLNFYMK
jgi:hypothetical protein